METSSFTNHQIFFVTALPFIQKRIGRFIFTCNPEIAFTADSYFYF